MIELANALDRLLQFLIIVQPAAYLGNPFTPHAELTRASSWIGHSQNKHLMPFAACAFGQSLLWWIVRFNSEPRSNSPVTGNLLTSFWRARRLCSRIIHKNESQTANSSNLNFV